MGSRHPDQLATDQGWMPVLSGLDDVALVSGGTVSHGGIIAREFGLPPAGPNEQGMRISVL